jgi:translocation protein SEC62
MAQVRARRRPPPAAARAAGARAAAGAPARDRAAPPRAPLNLPPRRPAQPDAIRAFADQLRARGGGVEARSAVLGNERVEVVRGKDLARWVAAHQAEVDLPAARGRPPADAAAELAALLLRRGLLVRVARRFLKPPPGQARLAKFPRKVQPVPGPDAQRFDAAAFYAWTYERPASPWALAWAALAAAGVLAVCLFPMAPNWAKIGVVYVSSTLLTLILGALLLRALVAAASWIGAGRTVWLLPNLLSEEVPVSQLLRPLAQVFDPPAAGARGAWAAGLPARAGAGAALAALGWLLYAHSPDAAGLKSATSKYRDELFDLVGVKAQIAGSVAGAAAAPAAAAPAPAPAKEAPAAAAAPAAGQPAAAGEAAARPAPIPDEAVWNAGLESDAEGEGGEAEGAGAREEL